MSAVAASSSVVAVQEECSPALLNRRIVETSVVSNEQRNRERCLGEGRNLPIKTGDGWRKTPNGCGGLGGDTMPVALTAFWQAGQSD